MGPKRLRPMLFIAAGIVVAALIGVGVWYAGAPSSGNNTSNTALDAVPSTETVVSTSHTTSEAPASPTTSKEVTPPESVGIPNEDDPFLPPNAILAAPESIERETTVYRPPNIFPDPPASDYTQPESSELDGSPTAGPVPSQSAAPSPSQQSETTTSADQPSTTPPTASPTEPSLPIDLPTEVPPLIEESETPATESSEAPTAEATTTEPTTVPTPEPAATEQETDEQTQAAAPVSNNDTASGNSALPTWWQELQGQFIR